MEPNRKPEALGVSLRLENGDLAFDGGRGLATVAGGLWPGPIKFAK